MKNMILPEATTNDAKATAKQIGALLMSPGLTLNDIKFAAKAMEQIYRTVKPEIEAQQVRYVCRRPLKYDVSGFAKKNWEV